MSGWCKRGAHRSELRGQEDVFGPVGQDELSRAQECQACGGGYLLWQRPQDALPASRCTDGPGSEDAALYPRRANCYNRACLPSRIGELQLTDGALSGIRRGDDEQRNAGFFLPPACGCPLCLDVETLLRAEERHVELFSSRRSRRCSSPSIGACSPGCCS